MKQWLAIVLGTVAMCALALLLGDRQPQGDSVVPGTPASLPSTGPPAVFIPPGGLSAEALRAILSPATTTTTTTTTTTMVPRAGTVGFDRPLPSVRRMAEVGDGTGVRLPAGPHESGSPARAIDITTDKEMSAVSTTTPELVTRELLEDIVREFFPGDEYEYAAAVVACESAWDPDAIWTGAKNKTPQTKSAAGMFQFIQRTWVWIADDAGVDPDPAARLDPVQATQAARFLVDRAGGGWSHWECAP